MFQLSEQVNKEDQSKLNIIITGRTQFFLPVRHCIISDAIIYELDNFSEEQTDRWLHAFFQATKQHPVITREQLNVYHLKDLMKQPILLTICTTMMLDILKEQTPDGESTFLGKFKEEICISQIYAIIVEWTYIKRHQSGAK
jgi:hypothetical protein